MRKVSPLRTQSDSRRRLSSEVICCQLRTALYLVSSILAFHRYPPDVSPNNQGQTPRPFSKLPITRSAVNNHIPTGDTGSAGETSSSGISNIISGSSERLSLRTKAR